MERVFIASTNYGVSVEETTHRCAIVRRGAHLRELCASCRGLPPVGQRTLASGALLCLEGEPASHVFAVVSGWLRALSVDPEGKLSCARLIGPGSVIGLEALVAGTYPLTIEALRPSRVCILPAAQARSWLATHPEDALGLAVMTAADLTSVQQQLMRNSSLDAEERVFALIRDFAQTDPPGRWVNLPGTRQQIGELLGLTVETVSRSVQRLRREGRIDVRGSRVRLLPGEVGA